MWKNSTDENLMSEARYEIARSVARSRGETAPTEPEAVLAYLNDKALPIYDPFAGGGSIPLEAQRLGLRAVASDLNPVAVLINKALIELPPKFNNRPPVNPDADPMGMFTGKHIGRGKNRKPEQVAWRGAAGLADDIRYYGRWMREEAYKRIGHLYPKAKLTDGREATVIAWVWARTIPCTNPACGIRVPLMSTFQLSKGGRKRIPEKQYWVKPIVDQDSKTISWNVQNDNLGVRSGGTKRGKSFICPNCNISIPMSDIRKSAEDGHMSEQMVGIVAEGEGQKRFLPPTDEHIRAAHEAEPSWRPFAQAPSNALGITLENYGVTHWHQIYTDRQLLTLTTLSDLIKEVHIQIERDSGDLSYANAVCTYLALAIGRLANGGCRFTRWENSSDFVAGVFSSPSIRMAWDFGEANPFSKSTKNWIGLVDGVAQVLERLPINPNLGEVHQADASTTIYANNGPVIVTDPPYYDNIGYADLSDFFYIWLRPVLRDIHRELFSSILSPKEEEMIASPHRFNESRQRFEDLLSTTLSLIRERCSPEFPSSIFYAYKQQEEQRDGTTSTGWETMLTALVNSGFQLISTWPMRTELSNRQRANKSNALASSVVLVCRPRPGDAPIATRRQFLDALQSELPDALDHLTREGHIAPTDLRQAAIGPGMEMYSRYSAVNTLSGEPVSVRDAPAAINQEIENYFEAQEGELDAESRFCTDWLKEHGYAEGEYGQAEVLSQAMNVAIESESMSGLMTAEAGSVKLRRMDEYGPDRPLSRGMSAWEGCMRMSYHLNREYGEGVAGAADVARQMVGMGADVESVERLARILYNHYDSRNDSPNAVIFNNLVTSWQDILTQMQEAPSQRLFA